MKAPRLAEEEEEAVGVAAERQPMAERRHWREPREKTKAKMCAAALPEA